MKMTSLLLTFLICLPQVSLAQHHCSTVLSDTFQIKGKRLRFSQNFLGHEWANHKLELLLEKYDLWRKENPKGSKREFAEQATLIKPLPVYRDTHGNLRLLDKHHGFYAYKKFMGFRSFSPYVALIRDYSLPNPLTEKPWQESEMMADIKANNFANLDGVKKPTYKDLKKLPHRIGRLSDLPVRSEMSFLLASFDVPMKGSDFKPMFQKLLAEEIINHDIEPFLYKPHGKKNINNLRSKVLKRPQILQFMYDNVNPNLEGSRKTLIQEFLVNQIYP